ncbi:hypothetical protein DH09_13985 [Bacillaceae bacterium JMAK1]|nr:hypothetical protein DH09_13985 [Bacillaceae bacterium JMAK1]
MQPYTLTASKVTDETKEKPYQVKISITFHDDQFYEKIFEFCRQQSHTFFVPSEKPFTLHRCLYSIRSRAF